MMQKGKIHQQLMQEAISGTFDQAKLQAVQALAAQQGQIEAQMAVEHARIASQIYNNVLTADQKTKAQQLLQQHIERMQQHMQEHGQAPAAEQ
jgi:Spy/CpxP family protein refolding chaperone